MSTDLWEYYLPYLYSCISLFGVLLLLRESWLMACPVLGAGPMAAWLGAGSSPYPYPFWGCREG